MPKIKTVVFYLPKIVIVVCAKKIPSGFLKFGLIIIAITLISLSMIASRAKSLNATKIPKPLSLFLNSIASISIDYIILINILLGAWMRGFPPDYNKNFWRCINFNWPPRTAHGKIPNKKRWNFYIQKFSVLFYPFNVLTTYICRFVNW